MMAARLESSVLPSGNFSVQLAPGPDNINWPALWTPWLQVGRDHLPGSCPAAGCLHLTCPFDLSPRSSESRGRARRLAAEPICI